MYGVFASQFGNRHVESDGIFVVLVRPLFEALGDQNKQIQGGAALCLARVIDNMSDPPVSILQKMLARTMKLLKNPNFMAKPAVIELNKSLIQVSLVPWCTCDQYIVDMFAQLCCFLCISRGVGGSSMSRY